jgi:hypothetical protein
METPGRASLFSSVTIPRTVDTCAKAVVLASARKTRPPHKSLIRDFAFIKVRVNNRKKFIRYCF